VTILTRDYPRIAVDGETAKDPNDYERLGLAPPEPVALIREMSPLELVECSDDHLAHEFVTVHGNGLRYTGSEHNSWLRWDDACWVADDKMHRYTLAREVCRGLAKGHSSEPLRRSITSASRVSAVVELSRSDKRISLDKDALDSNPMLLNTPKGTVDLETGKLHRHDRTQYITKLTRYSPAKGKCPVFQLFLRDIFEGDEEMIAFMQRALGYCSTGIIREQVFFFAHGGGKNGKSTLFDVIEEIMGSYGHALSATALMSQQRSQHSTDIAMLEGVRLAFTTELDKSQRWNVPILKALTGNQRIAARRMHKDAGSFPNRVKLIISGNELPAFEGGDAAMERRILLIPFNAYFSEDRRDRDMPAKLMAEAPQILQWIIEGAVQYFSDGLGVPQKVSTESSRYFEEMDTVKAWADTCLIKRQGSFTSGKDLLEHYGRWSDDTAMSATEFKKHMLRLGFKYDRKTKARGFTGVKIATEFDSGPPDYDNYDT
jgi:putative DNA primase/helicase